MDGSKLKINPVLVLRALQALLAIVTLGLFAHVASWYNSNPIASSGTETPSSSSVAVPNEIIYAVFVTVLTILVTLPYTLLTPRYFPNLAHRYTILLLELLSMTLWFALWIAVASFLGRLSVCRGHVCGAAKAGVGLAAVEWIFWVVTSVFAVRFCWERQKNSGGAQGQGRQSDLEARGYRNGDEGEEQEEKKWMSKLRGWGVGSIIIGSGNGNPSTMSPQRHGNDDGEEEEEGRGRDMHSHSHSHMNFEGGKF